MSGAPKRGADDKGIHSSSSAMRPPNYVSEEEENHALPRHNYGPVQDSRPGLIPRPESRDGERRPPLHSSYRIPSSMNVSPHTSRPAIGPECMAGSGGSKEIRKSKGVECNRDIKVEPREVHYASVKVESGADDSKEVKYEGDSHNDLNLKKEIKVEKDDYRVAGSHSNWKEQHRGKRHPDVPGGGGFTVKYERDSHNDLNLKKEIKVEKDDYGVAGSHSNWKEQHRGKRHPDVPGGGGFSGTWNKSQVRVKYEAPEEFAVKENVEANEAVGENKDDVKRKKLKDHDWPESEKDWSNYRNNLQIGSSGNSDYKEAKREERESEWRERERKDIFKEKERQKDHGEGERPEKRSRCYNKELDEVGADIYGGTDGERDAFSYGVQQRKSMLQPRGSPQVAHRDARFKPCGQDAEESQGKSEVCTIYRVGECIQGLTKLWKEYESSRADKSSSSLYNGPTLEIKIPAEHVTTRNHQVRCRRLWGTDIYTDDSDLVAVLLHTGYFRLAASPPPAAVQELRATIRVLPPQDSYVSTVRNDVQSRAWGAATICSYRVESCLIMKKGGGTIDLEPCLTYTSVIEPTLAPVAVERTMTTRAAAWNASRKQRFARYVTIQYNLCNEPWIKYSLSIVADKGLNKPLYTSARLKKGEVLYLETHSCRYELCLAGEKTVKAPSVSQMHESKTDKSNNQHSVNDDRSGAKGDNRVVDMFRWSRCKKPLPEKVMRSFGIPLPIEHVEVLDENLDWEDVQWSQTGVWVAGKEYQLARAHFLSPN